MILNENGYPNMNMKEAFATIRFCINIFYSEANIMIQQLQSNTDNDESVSHGNFYVNDIKVRIFLVFLYYVPEPHGMLLGVTRNLFKRVN